MATVKSAFAKGLLYSDDLLKLGGVSVNYLRKITRIVV